MSKKKKVEDFKYWFLIIQKDNTGFCKSEHLQIELNEAPEDWEVKEKFGGTPVVNTVNPQGIDATFMIESVLLAKVKNELTTEGIFELQEILQMTVNRNIGYYRVVFLGRETDNYIKDSYFESAKDEGSDQ